MMLDDYMTVNSPTNNIPYGTWFTCPYTTVKVPYSNFTTLDTLPREDQGISETFTINPREDPAVPIQIQSKPKDDAVIVTSSPSCSSTSSIPATTSSKKMPLPSINYDELSPPEEIIGKHQNLLKISKIPTLAVKLAKGAYFGKDVMAACTVRGLGSYHALPDSQLKKLKIFLQRVCVPRLMTSHVEFEKTWKDCIESIGQSCKSARSCKT